MTGQTIPCFDQLGTKPSFSPTQPGIFQDFDQITFYRVNEAELEHQLALFRSGRYTFNYEESVFDMAVHNKLLEDTRDEVKAFKTRQAAAQEVMNALEKESMAKWMADKMNNQVSVNEIEVLRNGELRPNIHITLSWSRWKC